MTSPQSNALEPAAPQCVHFGRSNGACSGQIKPKDGVDYCALHHDADDRIRDFVDAFNQKLKDGDFNFAWVRFPLPIVLEEVEFINDADFSHARFTHKFILLNVTFEKSLTCFSTRFDDDVAIRARFMGRTEFTVCDFDAEANFFRSKFSGYVTFMGSKFGRKATFEQATFENDVNLSGTFRDSVEFKAIDGQSAFSPANRVAFDGIRVDRPELAIISNTPLRPWWFINSSPAKIALVDITWQNDIREELAKAIESYGSRGYRLLATAYRNLAVNSEEAHRYRQASDFRYSSMEALRLATNRGRAFWTLHWWYWVASGYGERIGRAALFLLALWFVFGLLYMRVGFTRTDLPAPVVQQTVVTPDEYGKPLRPGKALTYSLGVLSLQKPDPKPLTDTAQFAVILESVFGPLQAALLILAIRRKFMR